MKSKLPLIIALVIGVLALLAMKSYVGKQEEIIQTQLKGEYYIAARKDIPKNTEVTADMITRIPVPKQFVPAQAIADSAAAEQSILLRKTLFPIQQQKLILYSDFARDDHGGLSGVIPPNERAYTISIARGIKAGLIQPNDCIDIIGSFAAPKPSQQLPTSTTTWRQASDMVNVVLLQNVRVLATGETLGGFAKSDLAGVADLTVSVTLKEAQILMFAGEHGELGAVLRRDGATDLINRTNLPRVNFDVVETMIGDLDGARSFRSIEVQKGLKSDTISVTNSPSSTGNLP